MLGEVPEQLGVMWHNKQVLMTVMRMSKKAKKWNECDESLKAFAHMATMALVGCRFCLDLGYFATLHEGLDVAKAREVRGGVSRRSSRSWSVTSWGTPRR